MKRIQVIWGWNPPSYEISNQEILRIFYNNKQIEGITIQRDLSTGEEIISSVPRWLCDIIEYNGEEAVRIIELLRQNSESIDVYKWILIEKIKAYDASEAVNQFYVSDIPVWLDKATRAGLLLRFQAEQAQGFENTALWYDGIQFSLKVSQAIQMLYAIEMYASACYDNTQRHLAAVKELKTIEEIQNYDYRSGYPGKLRF